MSKTQSKNNLIETMLKGDKRSLARLMTYIDNRHEDLLEIMAEVYEHRGHAIKIGITGPPGAGKSTLVDKLIKVFRQENKKVGVVAVDPSSPFTGGAVLGDRIRMMDHGADEGVFIRSLGSRGAHGGLSRATRDIVNLMDAYGFDVILIETVGVGQTELDIMGVADTTVVVLVPESGDTIQTMKAGIMEIADIFVVNKADRDGADRIQAELMSLAELVPSERKVPVLKTEAFKNKGVKELVEEIGSHADFLKTHQAKVGKEQILSEECIDIFVSEIVNSARNKFSPKEEYAKEYNSLINDHHNPYQTASELIKKIF